MYGDPVDWSFKRYMACNLISKVNISVILDAQAPHAVPDDRQDSEGTREMFTCHSVEDIKAERERPTQFLPITPPDFFLLFYFEVIFFF